MRRHPHLYEANARLFIRRLSKKYNRALTLATVPQEEWQLLKQRGFDLLWLMGVWKRSHGAQKQALLNQALRKEYDQVLPGWTGQDIDGSPYAVYAYSLDPALGEPKEPAILKSKLNQQGIGLMLDFVPNHLAFDHPWVLSHPKRFVQGTKKDADMHPDWFFSPYAGKYLAHGRDPNFPPWTDTVQVNFYSNDLRLALINELLRIAEVCDGLRCDMAMLALNEVFEKVWGGIVKDTRPKTEFWTEAIGRVRQKWPDFVFLAEVYWGLEQKLQQIGFDFTYDRSRYELLRFSSANDIRSYLTMKADDVYQLHSARFIENHDEPRAITAFGRERSLAAAVILATLPGLRFFHDGQLEGRRLHLPVQLVREPEEPTNPEISKFYDRLLAICDAPAFHDGEWGLMEISQPSEGNESHQNMLAWFWRYAEQFKIVVVNYSANPSQCRLKLPLSLKNTTKLAFRDELNDTVYPQDPKEVSNQGLYIALDSYKSHILDMVR